MLKFDLVHYLLLKLLAISLAMPPGFAFTSHPASIGWHLPERIYARLKFMHDIMKVVNCIPPWQLRAMASHCGTSQLNRPKILALVDPVLGGAIEICNNTLYGGCWNLWQLVNRYCFTKCFSFHSRCCLCFFLYCCLLRLVICMVDAR